MDKTVIVINGKGGVGKDTLCEILAGHYKTVNISSITPIKKIALQHGWQGEKDERSRKFLSHLKQAFTDYNDLPNKYIVSEYERFLTGDAEILLVHIREGAQIDRFKRSVRGRCITLLVTEPQESGRVPASLGNQSDDNVLDYIYDYYYCNNKPLEELETDFLKFIRPVLG